MRETLSQHPDPSRPDHIILQLLEICLTHNDFMFDDRFYLQTHGTAMGQRFAPAYANIYMTHWEWGALSKCPLKPLFYYRYLDGCSIVGAWPYSTAQFTTFVHLLNTHHPTIKLKASINPISINFLDTTILLQTYRHTYTFTQNKPPSQTYFQRHH